MADRMHAFESEFQAYNPLMRKFLINEFNADLLMPDGDLEMTGLKSLRQF
jgi:lysine-N-methylase